MFPAGAQQGFYEAAAQVIPVLLLVLAVGEGRVFRTDDRPFSEWRATALVALLATGILILGEMASLRALERGHDSQFLRVAAVVALVYGFTFVFAQATKLILLGQAEHLPPQRKDALGRFYMLVVVIALVASFAILYPDLGLLKI